MNIEKQIIEPLNAFAVISPNNKILMMSMTSKFAKHHFLKGKNYDWKFYVSKGYRCAPITIFERK